MGVFHRAEIPEFDEVIPAKFPNFSVPPKLLGNEISKVVR